jgi:N-acetylmuramate 1-kinase
VLARHDPARTALAWAMVSGDASFRRFYRVRVDPGVRLDGIDHATLIAMDAPPDTENNLQFARLSALFRAHGVRVPAVLDCDFTRGFMLVEDLGDNLFADIYATPMREQALETALQMLIRIQRIANDDDVVPIYTTARFRDELELFMQWLVDGLLSITPAAPVRAVLDRSWRCLIDNTQAQPQCCVHRDFHSRNLLMAHDGQAAAVDFQDALWGPLSYDLVSLLRDCYVRFPDDEIGRWQRRYVTLADAAGIFETYDPASFTQHFDRTGVQRHLKAIGIFARLHLRDGKDGYLPVISSVLDQLIDVTARDAELAALGDWLATVVAPAANQRIAALTQDGEADLR